MIRAPAAECKRNFSGGVELIIDERGRVLGIVEFENGIRVMGLIKADEPKIGMKLQATMQSVRVISGVNTYGLTFEPTK